MHTIAHNLPHATLLQNSEQDQFLLEVPAHTAVAEAVRQVAEVHNLRHRITRLKLEGGELAKYGPAKHPDQQGIDAYADAPAAQQQPHYNMDPTGRRTGQGERGSLIPARVRAQPGGQVAKGPGHCRVPRPGTLQTSSRLCGGTDRPERSRP